MCRALAGYVLAQLPNMKSGTEAIRYTENAPAAIGRSGGNTDVANVLLKLDFEQKIKESAHLVLREVGCIIINMFLVLNLFFVADTKSY